jgi:hypothetical protein
MTVLLNKRARIKSVRFLDDQLNERCATLDAKCTVPVRAKGDAMTAKTFSRSYVI